MQPAGLTFSTDVPLRRFAAVFATFLLAALAASAQTPRVERYVGPPTGTAWSNRVLSSGSFGQKEETQAHRAGSRERGGERLTAIEGPNGTLLINANGEWVAIVDATKLIWLALRNITTDWGRAAKEDFDCPRLSRHTANEAAPFEPHEHRVHRRRREVEESLQVGMAWRHASPIGCNVLGDIGQELPLLARWSAGRCRGLGVTNAVCGVELVQRRVHGIGSELHRVARLERGLVDDDPVVEHGLKPRYALT